MSSFDKTVKLACKPKAAPPKAKYLDPIIAATYSEDGAIHDVCKALSPRFREPNAIVVFKALIVLHTMMRSGATENILSYLSSSDVLRLHNVSTGQWEGYSAPQNLQNYAVYLDTRIRTYKDLKHDPVRVQAEVNRDMRIDNSIEEDRARNRSGGISRSKTVTGRKLRVMTIEKGLLRETKAVQKVIGTLLECQFYLDDLEDELNITALRMLVKDLLVLFQAVNEGVINVLEHYFEMSHVDAEQALAVYRHFCKQTERVVEFLSIAKKLQNLLNVPVPNLKHAPVSLVGALEEYLTDPNFEQNRLEYKASKAAADKSTTNGSKPKPILKNSSKSGPSSSKASTSISTTPDSSSAPTAATSKPDTNQALVDFFSAIEEEQPNMFNPRTGSPTANYFQQQAAHNPFVQRQSMMVTMNMTGFPQPAFGQPPPVPQPQASGFLVPQNTMFPLAQQNTMNAFLPPQQHQSQQQHPPFASFLQPQAQQQLGFLQPQPTGSNPFRQSMMVPQMTGFQPFTSMGAGAGAPFPGGTAFQVPPPSDHPQSAQGASFGPTLPKKPFGQNQQHQQNGPPTRSASTPPTNNAGQGSLKPVVSQQTGSRNPFGIPQADAPPAVPKQPTLMELASGSFGQQQSPQQQGGIAGFSSASAQPGSPANAAVMSSIASSFSFNSELKPGGVPAPAAPSITGQTTSSTLSNSFTSFSSRVTDTTTSPPPLAPLAPQTTGFSGLKAFKPTSSFGASLLESLPPIPQGSVTPVSVAGVAGGQVQGTQASELSRAATGLGPGAGTGAGMGQPSANPSGLPSFTPPVLGALNSQATSLGGLGSFGTGTDGSGAPGSGSSLGVGLRPQVTGLGPNPFRMSMLNPPVGAGVGTGFSVPFGGQTSLFPTTTGAPPSFGTNFGQSMAGFGAIPNTGLDSAKQGQQNGVASLI